MLTVAFAMGEHMKEQYLGDVSDYRKYALLRALTAESNLTLGICWMLTPDDGRADGNRLKYLEDPAKWRPRDPLVFDLLKEVVAEPETRRLAAVEHSGVLGPAVFFDWHLPDDHAGRDAYMAEAKRLLDGCELVFFDPDNGLAVSLPKGRKNSSKYLYVDEAAVLWASGASLLIYQHYPMVKKAVFEARVSDRLTAALPGSVLFLFATAHALFILAAQPHHASHFAEAAARIVASWPGWFVELRPAPPLGGEQHQSAVPSVTTVTNGPRASAHEDVCEARVPGGEWTRIGITEAIDRRDTIEMRCVECHGRVRAHRSAQDQSFRAHFEHAQRHNGCSRASRFSGSKGRHPAAIG